MYPFPLDPPNFTMLCELKVKLRWDFTYTSCKLLKCLSHDFIHWFYVRTSNKIYRAGRHHVSPKQHTSDQNSGVSVSNLHLPTLCFFFLFSNPSIFTFGTIPTDWPQPHKEIISTLVSHDFSTVCLKLLGNWCIYTNSISTICFYPRILALHQINIFFFFFLKGI